MYIVNFTAHQFGPLLGAGEWRRHCPVAAAPVTAPRAHATPSARSVPVLETPADPSSRGLSLCVPRIEDGRWTDSDNIIKSFFKKKALKSCSVNISFIFIRKMAIVIGTPYKTSNRPKPIS